MLEYKKGVVGGKKRGTKSPVNFPRNPMRGGTLKAMEETPKKRGRRENLIPASERSPKERKELGRKGGLKAQECNRERRNAQEIMQQLLYAKIDVARAREKLGQYADFLPNDATFFDMISLVQVLTASDGSPKAFEVVRDTAGFKPVERQEITADIMTDNDRALLEKVAKRTGATGENTP